MGERTFCDGHHDRRKLPWLEMTGLDRLKGRHAMNSAVTALQQRPAAFWIYTAFIGIEIIGFAGFFSPIVSIPALAIFLVVGIWAYVERGRDSALDTHYQFQIRTFWINFIAGLALPLFFFVALFGGVGSFLMGDGNPVGLVLSVMVGAILPVLIGLSLSIWTIVRSVAGLSRLQGGKPIENPTTWMI
jgi:uncharacterized membrane protein